MSRPTVTVIGADGSASSDTLPISNVFKVSGRTVILNRNPASYLPSTRASPTSQKSDWLGKNEMGIWELEV